MDLGILLLRTTVGLALAAHGSQKVFGWFGGYAVSQLAQRHQSSEAASTAVEAMNASGSHAH